MSGVVRAEDDGPVRTGRDLVPLLFGAAEREQLSGRLLVGLLADLGVGASSARTLIARTVAWGGLESTRQGRRARYRIGAGIAAAFESLRRREAPPSTWDGSFHTVLYSVPEPHRAFRDLLRGRAQQAGYGTLRAGLMIRPDDAWADVARHLPAAPPGSSLRTGRLVLDLATSREVAAETWDLAALATAYLEQRDRLLALLDTPLTASATEEVVRRYVDGVRPVFQTLYADPNLPEALLPPSWPRTAATTALQRVIDGFRPAVQARLVEIERDG